MFEVGRTPLLPRVVLHDLVVKKFCQKDLQRFNVCLGPQLTPKVSLVQVPILPGKLVGLEWLAVRLPWFSKELIRCLNAPHRQDREGGQGIRG